MGLLPVDDNRHKPALLRIQLEHLDCEIAGEAEDGREAVERARELRPEIVIMDFHMPVVDGLEATRRICAEPDAPTVIAYTSLADDEAWDAFRAAGAVACFSKEQHEALIRFLQDACGIAPREP